MKAQPIQILPFIKKLDQLYIPIYQRHYSWTLEECKKLWFDIHRVGSNDKITAHFMGTIVYITENEYQVSSFTPILVIDGQQRLTTIVLLLAAIYNTFDQNNDMVNGLALKKIKDYYLTNPKESDDQYYKLRLTKTDDQSLCSIIKNLPKPTDFSKRIYENYDYFLNKLTEIEDISVMIIGLQKLMIVDISLERGKDNPQLIFESMNSTGLELNQGDLIRNFILMDLDKNLQTSLYNDYWYSMEKKFEQDGDYHEFDKFIRHYLTLKTGNIPNISKVYESFKEWSLNVSSKTELLKELHVFSEYYCRMAFKKEPDIDLNTVFQDLKELTIDVIYPFLLKLYHDYHQSILTKSDFIGCIQIIESYIFRRSVCSLPTNPLNKIFAQISSKHFEKNNYLDGVKNHFFNLTLSARYPTNEEFKKDIQIRNLYEFRYKKYWMRKIENADRKEKIVIDSYSIEHILPQNNKLSTEWQKDLGMNWQAIQNKYLHTLGNLTLTGYNSEYKDKSFKEKKEMKDFGFDYSPLKLNMMLRNVKIWNEDAIIQRAYELAEKAINIWQYPVDIVESSRNVNLDDIKSFPFLEKNNELQFLFEKLSSELYKLDPDINSKVTSLYLAFKFKGRNFIDIVPQKNRLKLFFNIKFSEIEDPDHRCEDVSNIGHWGNGEVQFILQDIQDISYVIYLAKQSLMMS